MWQDMGLYWAWRGKSTREDPPAPTKKVIRYAVVDGEVPYKIAAVVVDISFDGKKVLKRVNQQEIERCEIYSRVIHPSYELDYKEGELYK